MLLILPGRSTRVLNSSCLNKYTSACLLVVIYRGSTKGKISDADI